MSLTESVRPATLPPVSMSIRCLSAVMLAGC